MTKDQKQAIEMVEGMKAKLLKKYTPEAIAEFAGLLEFYIIGKSQMGDCKKFINSFNKIKGEYENEQQG